MEDNNQNLENTSNELFVKKILNLHIQALIRINKEINSKDFIPMMANEALKNYIRGGDYQFTLNFLEGYVKFEGLIKMFSDSHYDKMFYYYRRDLPILKNALEYGFHEVDSRFEVKIDFTEKKGYRTIIKITCWINKEYLK